MQVLAQTPSKTIGVLAQSRERFQSIANFLQEPCVWLAEPVADDPVPGVDTFIIDSDLLAADPVRVKKWREHYRPSTTPAIPDTRKPVGSPIRQDGDASLRQDERLAYFRECARQPTPTSPLKPGRVVIYQCSDHNDADNPLQST